MEKETSIENWTFSEVVSHLYALRIGWNYRTVHTENSIDGKHSVTSDIVSVLSFPNKLSLNTEKVDVKFHIRVKLGIKI